MSTKLVKSQKEKPRKKAQEIDDESKREIPVPELLSSQISSSATMSSAPPTYIIERAKSGRAECKKCDEKIENKTIRVGVIVEGQWGLFTRWQHLNCCVFHPLVIDTIPTLDGFKELNLDEQNLVLKRGEESRHEVDEDDVPIDPDALIRKAWDEPVEPKSELLMPLLPYQKEGLGWMISQEMNETHGGILADEMGMGKTIQAISLMLHNRPNPLDVEQNKQWELSDNSHVIPGVVNSIIDARGGTLLVLPTVAIRQWQMEINRFTKEGSLSIMIYHGSDRSTTISDLTGVDIVITSYKVLEIEYRKATAGTKVTCKICSRKFYPDKLRVHRKYFCGESAQRTAAQSKTQKKKQRINNHENDNSDSDGFGEDDMDEDTMKKSKQKNIKNDTKNSKVNQKSKMINLKTKKNVHDEEDSSEDEIEKQKKLNKIKELKTKTKLSATNSKHNNNNNTNLKNEKLKNNVIKKTTKNNIKSKSKLDSSEDEDESESESEENDHSEVEIDLNNSIAANKPKRRASANKPKIQNIKLSLASDEEDEEEDKSESGDDIEESSYESASSNDNNNNESESNSSEDEIDKQKRKNKEKAILLENKKTTKINNKQNPIIQKTRIDKKRKRQTIPSESESDSSEDEIDKQKRKNKENVLKQKNNKLNNKKIIKSKKNVKKGQNNDDDDSNVSDENSNSDDSEVERDIQEALAEVAKQMKKSRLEAPKSILHHISWFRIILDEAHLIKDRSSSTSKAAFHLVSLNKWCLTGTPLQNRVGELYSLIRFLRIDPHAYYFCKSKNCSCKSLYYQFTKGKCNDCNHNVMQHYCHFNKHILNPIKRSGYVADGRKAMLKLKQQVLDEILLRRTKTTRADDIQLPPRIVKVRQERLDEKEEDFYQALYTQ
eukprot:gene16128-21919_t